MIAGAVILAAGQSSRMQGGHKLLLDWLGKPLIAHAVDAVLAAGLPPPVIVLGARADDIRAALGDRPGQYVTASDYVEGMSRSLRAGIAAVPEYWTAALICLGDMPRVPPAVIAAIAARASPSAIVQPTHNGTGGHPVLWGRDYFPALLRLEGDGGGKALLRCNAQCVEPIETADDGILIDIDTSSNINMLRAGNPLP